MSKKVAVIVGNNFEEIEMITTVDVLRRAKVSAEIVSLFNQKVLVGAHGIKVESDRNFSDFQSQNYDGIVIPGGAGVDSGPDPLIDQAPLIELIQQFYQEQKLVGAICAAPQVLGKAGVVKDLNITHFPDSTKFLENSVVDLNQTSIIDGHIITARSAGTAIDFALNLVGYLTDEATKQQVSQGLVIKY